MISNSVLTASTDSRAVSIWDSRLLTFSVSFSFWARRLRATAKAAARGALESGGGCESLVLVDSELLDSLNGSSSPQSAPLVPLVPLLPLLPAVESLSPPKENPPPSKVEWQGTGEIESTGAGVKEGAAQEVRLRLEEEPVGNAEAGETSNRNSRLADDEGEHSEEQRVVAVGKLNKAQGTCGRRAVTFTNDMAASQPACHCERA
jgi:hypothetical protein